MSSDDDPRDGEPADASPGAVAGGDEAPAEGLARAAAAGPESAAPVTRARGEAPAAGQARAAAPGPEAAGAATGGAVAAAGSTASAAEGGTPPSAGDIAGSAPASDARRDATDTRRRPASAIPAADLRAATDSETSGRTGGRSHEPDERPRRRRTVSLPGIARPPGSSSRALPIALAATALLVVVTVLGGLGWRNRRDYFLVCRAEAITAERGRFWPWGRTALEDPRWQAVQIAPATECRDQTFASEEQLQEAFVGALLRETSRLLSTSEPAPIELAEKQLKQALLLSRAPRQRRRREHIQRLQGDVEYQRGRAELRTAATALERALTHLREANRRHGWQSSAATAWADVAAHTLHLLQAGPEAAPRSMLGPSPPEPLGPDLPPDWRPDGAPPAVPPSQAVTPAGGAPTAHPVPSAPAAEAPGLPLAPPENSPGSANQPGGGVLL